MYTQISSKTRTHTTTHMTNSTPFTLVCVQTLLIIFNTVSVIYRAYTNRHYSFLAFILFVYFNSFLAYYLLTIYRSLPSKNKSLEKTLLGFTIWFLISSVIVGFVYQFYPVFGFWAGFPIYLIAIAVSGVMFNDYVVSGYQEEKWEVIWEKV
ncbi:unnamed protein product [Withania somnifera]